MPPFFCISENPRLYRGKRALVLRRSNIVKKPSVWYICAIQQQIYGKLKKEIGAILRSLCERKGVELIEAEACPDHVHMLISVPPKLSVSDFMGYLKGKSTLMIFERHASMNAKGAIDFSRNFQIVCTLETPKFSAVRERFINNPIICSQIKVELEPADNIQIIIDGREQDIPSKLIESVEVSMLDEGNYINKLDLINYSKVRVFREKILGYL